MIPPRVIASHTAVEVAAELIQKGLQLGASAVIGSLQACLQFADCLIKPMQIASLILLRHQFHILHPQIAFVVVIFDLRLFFSSKYWSMIS